MNIVNIAGYKFISMSEEEIKKLRPILKDKALEYQLKGTIILSMEGIKVELAGTRECIEHYKSYLENWQKFTGIAYKESISDHQPFSCMLVRLKKEIISMGRPEIQPGQKTAPHLSPEEFKKWYEQGRDMIVLDTRNDYEIELGTFENAIDLNLETFRAFPDVVEMLPDEMKEKPVIAFCTGGIRCEKAAEFMLDKGFKEVYQLEGGILNYFKQCGGDHYTGECFVFDKRVALDANLQETNTMQCFKCRNPVSVKNQNLNLECPHCHEQEQIG